jgi:uncharacterized protein YbjT (DUF2867 family)
MLEVYQLILVTGAAGKTGKAVISKLVAAGLPVKAMVHSDNKIIAMREMGCQEVVVADMLDQEMVNEAFKDAQQVYHICPNMNPDEEKIGRIMIEAATNAGIKQFVYHSVLHPQVKTMAHHWHKLKVEEQLMMSSLNFTILQPAAYMQNILGYWEKMMDEGMYAIPYSIDSRSSMIDLNDLSDVVLEVLTRTGHEYAIYELSSCQTFSARQIADIVSKKTGKLIKASALDRIEWEKTMRTRGMSDYAVDTLLKMFEYYEDYNFIGNCNQLRWLLGREPVKFEQFIENYLKSIETKEN